MTPLPGDWGVTPTSGSGLARVVGPLIRWGEATKHGKLWLASPVNHAVTFVGDVPGKAKPQILEAKPHGSVLSDWDIYPGMMWSTGRLPSALTPTEQQRSLVTATALEMVGIPYGFVDYLAIIWAQPRFGGEVDAHRALRDQPWWVRSIESTRTAICSQLVDEFQQRLGVQLFDDHRIPGLVTPQDLYALLYPLELNSD